MTGQPLLLHKPSCPQFLHSSSNGLISAYQVQNPCHIPIFLYLIQSCHYLLHFLHQLLPLSVQCLTYLIRKCFTSSTSPLSHSVHFLSPLFKPLHLPTSTCSCAVPPLASSVFFSSSFSYITPTFIASNSLLTSSFNTPSFGRFSNSSAHIVVTSLHAQFFIMYFTSAFDMPFKLSNLTSSNILTPKFLGESVA